MRRMAMWGLVLVVLLAAGACSDDDDSAEDDGSTPTTEAAESDPSDATLGPCPYVTTEDVAEAFGLAVELLDGSEDACDFLVGDAATLLVSADLASGDCDPDTEVEGDGGSACLIGGVPTATASTNEYAVSLTVTGEVAAPQTRDALVRLLPQVTPDG